MLGEEPLVGAQPLGLLETRVRLVLVVDALEERRLFGALLARRVVENEQHAHRRLPNQFEGALVVRHVELRPLDALVLVHLLLCEEDAIQEESAGGGGGGMEERRRW